MTKLMVLVLCTLLIGTPGSAPKASQSSAPYLSYFESARHTFVIERADGTDSREFGAGLMSPDTNTIAGAGWSPSGKWFAWTASQILNEGGYFTSGSKPFAVSVDGKRRVRVLDDMNYVGMAWSPVDDIIFVSGLVNPPTGVWPGEPFEGEQRVTLRLAMISPEADTILQSKDVDFMMTADEVERSGSAVFWTADGKQALALFSLGYTSAKPMTLHVLGRDGSYRLAKTFAGEPPVISRRGWLRVDSATTLVFENVTTGQQQTYLLPDMEVQTIEWNATGSQALVKTTDSPCSSGCKDHLLLLSADSDRVREVMSYPGIYFATWSPNGTGFAFNIDDGSKQLPPGGLNYADTATLTVRALGHVSGQPVWIDDGRIMAVSKLQGSNAMEFAVYDVRQTATLEPVSISLPDSVHIPADGTWPDISADGRYAVLIVDGILTMNLADGSSQMRPPDQRRYLASGGGEVEWHPRGDWALLQENAVVAGGGAPRWTGVMSGDGTIRRDLGFCYTVSPLCIDWLPDQVNPADLSPGKDVQRTQPLNEIANTHWMGELIWSPDGRQIAASGDTRLRSFDNTSFEIWDIASAKQLAVIPDVAWTETIVWENGEANVRERKVDAQDSAPRVLAISPDGSLRAQLDKDGIFSVVDTRSGEQVYTETVQPWVLSADFSPDGKLLAIGGPVQRIFIADARSGKMLAELPVYGLGAKFSPDGKQLATATSWAIQFWDVMQLLKKP